MKPSDDSEERPKSKLTQEEERLVQLRNEKTRLEKEIDILKIRYEDRQIMFQTQERSFRDKVRVDEDAIARQLADNKAKSDKLDRTQSEVNQLKAQMEESLRKQRDLLLKKEVELDQDLEKVRNERAEIAKRIK